MYSVDKCPCCNEKKFTIYHAIVAPFISNYVLKKPVSTTSLVVCEVCSFRFYQERFTPNEVKQLYGEYRSENYLKERHKYEFWYTEAVNANLGNAPQEIIDRNQRTYNFIHNLHPEKFQKILDYGGDKGQFIPENLGEKSFVYEISSSEVVPGVQLIKDEGSLYAHQFDLLFLAHVLEHSSEPEELLKKITSHLSDQNPHLYVEVPFERHHLSSITKVPGYLVYLNLLIRLPILLTAIDFLSIIFKRKFNLLPAGCFLKLHEHINFFNEKSLEILLKRSGFKVSKMQTYESDSNQVLMCLAVKV